MYWGAQLNIPLQLARPLDLLFFVPSSVIQELFASGSAPASLCQKFSRPLAQSGRFGSQLQAPYETSSVTSSTFLQPNFQPRLHLDSSAPKQQVVGPSMDVLGSSFCGKIPLSSSEPFLDNRCFQVWLGCRLPPSSGVGPLVQTGISCSYQLLRTLYGIPRSSEFRGILEGTFGPYFGRTTRRW